MPSALPRYISRCVPLSFLDRNTVLRLPRPLANKPINILINLLLLYGVVPIPLLKGFL